MYRLPHMRALIVLLICLVSTVASAQTPFDLQPRSGETQSSTPVIKRQASTRLSPEEARGTAGQADSGTVPTVVTSPSNAENTEVNDAQEALAPTETEVSEPEALTPERTPAETEATPEEELTAPSAVESPEVGTISGTPESSDDVSESSPLADPAEPIVNLSPEIAAGSNPFHLAGRASESAIADARKSGLRKSAAPKNNLRVASKKKKIERPGVASSSGPADDIAASEEAPPVSAAVNKDAPEAKPIADAGGTADDASPTEVSAGDAVIAYASDPEVLESPDNGSAEILDKIEDAVESDGRITEVFTGAEIGPISLDEKGGVAGSDYRTLLFWILLVLSLVASVLIYLERQTILGIFRAMNNSNFMDMLYRKRNANSNLIYSMLYVLFFINGGIFLYLIVSKAMQWTAYKYLLLSVVVIAGIYIVKHLIVLAVGIVYPIERLMKSYSFSIILTNSAVGLVLLPLNYVMAFADTKLAMWAMWLGIGVFALFYLMRNLRTTFAALPLASRSYLHFLLYLCTVELMPLGVLWKVLT